MGSVARCVLFPIQDVLGLDSSCRMNLPGTGQGNWAWRYCQKQLNSGTAAYLKELSELFGRNQSPAETADDKSEEVDLS